MRKRAALLLLMWAIFFLATWQNSLNRFHRDSLILVQRRGAGLDLLLLPHVPALALLAPRLYLGGLLHLRHRLLRDLLLLRALPHLWLPLLPSFAVLLRPPL